MSDDAGAEHFEFSNYNNDLQAFKLLITTMVFSY